jgi:hypothetical protein
VSRNLPTGMAAAVSAASVAPVFLAHLNWPTGAVRAWTGYGNITWDSQTWVGTGHLGGISDIRESADGSANGVTLSLSGIPSAEIARALEGDSQGRSGKIYFGVLSSSGTFAIDPYLIFDGLIDVCPLDDNGETATISVQLEKELIDMRTRGRRYTHEDQQLDHPGDLGFEYIAGLADKEVKWGTVEFAAYSGVDSGGSEESDDYS